MRNFILLICIVLFFEQCVERAEPRYFFKMSNSNLKDLKTNLPFLGLDSLVLDSLSTAIQNKNYWYLSSATDGLINIEGYLRRESDIIFIKATDSKTIKNVPEQAFLDFTSDLQKSFSVNYVRNNGQYKLTITKQSKFYNKLIKDTVVVFKVYSEINDVSLTKEFLMQVSLEKGFVSFRYLAPGDRKIYTIDYLPFPKVTCQKLTDSIYIRE